MVLLTPCFTMELEWFIGNAFRKICGINLRNKYRFDLKEILYMFYSFNNNYL